MYTTLGLMFISICLLILGGFYCFIRAAFNDSDDLNFERYFWRGIRCWCWALGFFVASVITVIAGGV